ncbi:MAG: SGNH/GDSL hydrolase family protein [Oligoflexales bacterium]|nr:SGNH/GDSL hydrolase family protein [Oligoflexales bacterium]
MKNTIFTFILISLIGCGANNSALNQNSLGNSQEKYGDYSKNDGSGGIRIFGDSIFTTSDHRIKKQLESLASISITDHAVGGAIMSQIKDQYIANRTQKIKTVIMDGGGNDILGNKGNCQNQMNDTCKSLIKSIVDTLRGIFELMKEDGVHQIVFLGCHYPMGWNGGFEQSVDYGHTLLEVACSESTVPCMVVDPRQTFKNKSDLLEWDGVHPNWNGTAVMAKLIWDETQKNKVEL